MPSRKRRPLRYRLRAMRSVLQNRPVLYGITGATVEMDDATAMANPDLHAVCCDAMHWRLPSWLLVRGDQPIKDTRSPHAVYADGSGPVLEQDDDEEVAEPESVAIANSCPVCDQAPVRIIDAEPDTLFECVDEHRWPVVADA